MNLDCIAQLTRTPQIRWIGCLRRLARLEMGGAHVERVWSADLCQRGDGVEVLCSGSQWETARIVCRLKAHAGQGGITRDGPRWLHSSLLGRHVGGDARPIEVVGKTVLAVRIEGHTYAGRELKAEKVS